MLPCEFCDGLVPMRKLLEHQVFYTNVLNPLQVPKYLSHCINVLINFVYFTKNVRLFKDRIQYI